MSVNGVGSVGTIPNLPEEVTNLRTQINQLRQEAGATPPDSTSFHQNVHQLRAEMNVVDQAVSAFKSGQNGGGEPITAMQTLQQDVQTAETGVQNLAAALSGATMTPPTPGTGADPATSVDVLA
jgi:capsule polysaccharide export protein KpsE/RkpR